MIASFAPVFNKDCRALVVGSMPSVESLARGEYYAHPRNAFWPIMADLFGEERGRPYADRRAMLLQNGLALWDVLLTCEREGSLDSAIRSGAPNDFGRLFAQTRIERVWANGQTAAKLFRRYAALPDGVLFMGALPSTSPAYTLPYDEKLRRWREITRSLYGIGKPDGIETDVHRAPGRADGA